MVGRQFLLDLLPKGSVGAEVGVWTSHFSTLLLDNTDPEKLYLIDPWLWVLPTDIPKDYYIANTKIAKSQSDMDTIYETVKAKFADNKKVEVIRERSTDAAKDFQDEFLDWIYIDGAHDYDNVLADLVSWGNKIKIGGLLTGDDFEWGKKYKFPVKRAVQEFLNRGQFEKVKIEKGQFVLRRIK